MKKTIRVAALLMALLMVGMVFVACGGKTLSGTYKGELSITLAKYEVAYSFSGNKVTVTHQLTSVLGNADPVEIQGTYEIIENDLGMQIKFTFEVDDAVIKGGTYDFEETENGIKISGIEYKKQ